MLCYLQFQSPRFHPSPPQRRKPLATTSTCSSSSESPYGHINVKTEPYIGLTNSDELSKRSYSTTSSHPELQQKDPIKIKSEVHVDDDNDVTIIEGPMSTPSTRPVSPLITMPSGSFSKVSFKFW
jgi:hypothetical protein